LSQCRRRPAQIECAKKLWTLRGTVDEDCFMGASAIDPSPAVFMAPAFPLWHLLEKLNAVSFVSRFRLFGRRDGRRS
jgi:hypothetical protein